jgi:hypothetical protein
MSHGKNLPIPELARLYVSLCINMHMGHGTQTQKFIAGKTPRARNARGTTTPLEGPKKLMGGIAIPINDFVPRLIIFSLCSLGSPQRLR